MAVSMIKKWIRCEPAPWDMGVAGPVELRPSRVNLSKLVVLGLTLYELSYGDPPERSDHSRPRLSRSLKVSGTDMDRSAKYGYRSLTGVRV